MGRVLSWLGLKPKLLFGSKLRGRRKPRFFVASRIDLNAGVVWDLVSVSGQGKGEMSPEKTPAARELLAIINAGSVLMGCSQEMRSTSMEGVDESPVPMGSTQIVSEAILTAMEAADIPGKTSPEFTLALEVAQSPSVLLDEGSILMGCSQIVLETRLTLTEGVEECPTPMGSTQFVPETILTSTKAVNLASSELA